MPGCETAFVGGFLINLAASYSCRKCGYEKSVPPEYREAFAKKYKTSPMNCPKCEEKSVPSIMAPGAPAKSRITDYEVKKGPLGASVNYSCPRCKSGLTNSLDDAGGADKCPDCGMKFIVPGEFEREQHSAEKAQSEQQRRKEREMSRAAATTSIVNRAAEKHQRKKQVQLDRDPFKEWLLYGAVLAVVVALSAGRFLVPAVTNDESRLCIVIYALFLFGVLINVRGIFQLRTEFVCAADCIANLKKPKGFEAITGTQPAGVLHQHIVDLARIARFDDGFSQDSLVTFLYSRMMAKSKIVDVLAGVLVSLGLVGTIVGLISMTDGLSGILANLGKSAGENQLMAGMRTTLEGLGTAFNTTLVGAIFGSVVLRILNNVYASNVDHLVSFVATTAEVSIIPQLKNRARKGQS